MIRPVRTRPCVHLWPERKIESQFSQFPGKSTAQVLVSGIIIKQELVLDNNLPENCPVLIISLSVLMITNRSVGDVNINTDTSQFPLTASTHLQLRLEREIKSNCFQHLKSSRSSLDCNDNNDINPQGNNPARGWRQELLEPLQLYTS